MSKAELSQQASLPSLGRPRFNCIFSTVRYRCRSGHVIACRCILIALFAVLLISVVVRRGVARAAVDYTTTHVVARRLYTTRRIDRCNRQRAPSAPQYRRPDRAVTSWCFRLIREIGRFGTYWGKSRWRALAENGRVYYYYQSLWE